MTKSEMRMIRRQFISEYLQETRFLTPTLAEMKYLVRFLERVNYSYELAAYKMFP